MKIYVFEDKDDNTIYSDVTLDDDDIFQIKMHEMVQRKTINNGKAHYIGVTYKEGKSRFKKENELFDLDEI